MNEPRQWGAAALRLTLLTSLVLGPSGCSIKQEPAPTFEDAGTSPNASILPAPITSNPQGQDVGATKLDAGSPDAGQPDAGPRELSSKRGQQPDASVMPPVEPLRGDQALPLDTLSAKETGGVLLSGEWRWSDIPSPPKAPEVHLEGLAAARRQLTFKWRVMVAEAGRMRVLFDGRAFPLPQGTELRARADHYGHALVFPGGNEYRPVPPGALRALFSDRRLDVSPLVSGEQTSKGNISPRFGRPTHRIELSSRLGVLTLDLITMHEAGHGAALLCRSFAELVAINPSTPACEPYELPVRAQISWAGGGAGVTFEATELAARSELSLSELHCPPQSASFTHTAMPEQPSSIILTREEMAALRSRAIDVGPPAPGAPTDGLLAKNATDSLRYLLLDGIALAWLVPGNELSLIGPQRGRYVTQWRTFLGDQIDAPQQIELPARVSVGEPPPPKTDPGTPAPAKSK